MANNALLVLIISCCMVATTLSRDLYMDKLAKIPDIKKLAAEKYPEFNEKYLVQKVDHFNPEDLRTYKQRYNYSTKYFDEKIGPIFIMICGEAECNLPLGRMHAYRLAEEHNAIFYLLEHRYYGKSQLFDDWSYENMKYLTVENALADVAAFVEAKQQEFHKRFNTPLRRKVITFGGSYPGALSAWFRLKYPHLTDGSISSSGVVQPMYEFPQFDKQINESMAKSPGCLEVAGDILSYVEEELDSKDQSRIDAVYKLFGAGKEFDPVDLTQFITQVFVEKVQYGQRIEICNNLVAYGKFDRKTKVWMFTQYAGPAGKDFISDVQDTKIDHTKNMRQWWWQVCTQMGFMFVPAKDSKLTSKKCDMDYWLGYCKRAFGREMYPERGILEMNLLFGATKINGSNIFFANGIEDGWRWAGVQEIKAKGTSMFAHVNDCDDCGHCFDLHDEQGTDPEDLKNCRDMERLHINRWLQTGGYPEDSQLPIITAQDA